ncbi:hypothetical protein ACO0QE_003837 [Hanseniaspora vineae]
MAKKRTSRNHNKKRAQNALEIAERELYAGMSSSDEDDRRNNPRLNGTIVNPQKRARGNTSDAEGDDEDDEDDFEDEEIDSDEAFGSDEEIDVLDSRFSQTIRDKLKNGEEIDEIDEEDGYTSIDEDDLLPLSAIWDANEKVEKDDSMSSSDKQQPDLMLNDDDVSSASESEESESESEDDEEEESDDPFDEVSDGEVDLKTVAKNLNDKTTSKQQQYKKLDNAAVGEENEYALPSLNNSTSTSLNLADILSVVDDPDAVNRASLIKKGENQAMAAPLPQRIQKRNERKAAYEISKDEVSKWQDTVQQNRRADHLDFSKLNETDAKVEASTFTPIEKPMTELEKKVSEVMKQSNLTDITKKESTFEEIATAKMSPEEMRKRTAELRLMRDLMFREERKAKRIKKIKSKAYRRIKKKEMLKNQALVDEDEEEDEQSKEDRDIARAKERMTLKHKTSSKWAQDMIKHGMTKDKETRDEMEEMLRQGERLKAKIMGHESGEESDRDLDNLDSSDDENDTPETRASVGKSGVLNMAFMKNAEARERERNLAEAEELKQLRDSNGLELFQHSSADKEAAAGANVHINAGRRVYTPGTVESNEEMKQLDDEVLQEREIDEQGTIEKRIAEKQAANTQKKKTKNSDDKSKKEATGEANPWLDGSDDEDYQGQKSSKVHVVDANSSKLSKAASKISKNQAKHEAKKKNKKGNSDDLILDLESSNTLNIVDPYGGSDSEEFKQQDVIAEAFAGDDVVSKFDEEKKRVAIDEDDKEVDVTLPGWGDWAGEGMNPRKKRKFVKTVKGVVNKDKRRDKNLKHVIINEKVNKKNLKYQSSAVPFPYENREQYERSLRMPIGQEWTSSNTFSKAIKPRVVTKPSAVIDPLKQPFK